MNKLFALMALCVMTVVVLPAEAVAFGGGVGGFHFGLSGFKNDSRASGDDYNPAVESSVNHVDVKLGYLGDNSIYFGAIYSTLNEKSGTLSPSRNATGVTLGYHSDGWFFDLSYIQQAEHKFSSTQTFKEGTGIQAEVGYNFMMSSNFYLGLEAAYKTFSYKKANSGASDYSRSNTFTELLPMFNLGFYF